MRIAIVLEYGTLNGGERSMLAVVDELRRQDPDRFEFVAVIADDGPLCDALNRRSIALKRFHLREANGRRLPRETIEAELASRLQNLEPNLIHANSLAMGRLVGSISAKLEVPSVGHLRDILKLSRAAVDDLNRNDCLIAVSHATRDFHVAQGLDAPRTEVIHNGIDTDEFRPRPATGRLKEELSLPSDAFLIGTIGQIGLRKAQDVLAEAASIVAPSRPDIHFLLIGERHSTKPESVRFERDLITRFNSSGLSDRFHRLGFREDVPSLLNEIDLLAHPARQEPFGRVLLEAAAAGVPIVTTRAGGTEEMLKHGETALIVPVDDPIAMAEATIRLHDDSALRERIGKNARTHIAKTFSIERAAAKTADAWLAVRVER